MYLFPTSAEVTYTDQIADSPLRVLTSQPASTLFFGTLWFPYDRELPLQSAGRLCTPGTVVRDWSVEEAPVYACCVPAANGSVCPVPPPSQADILRALLFERPVEVWWQNGTGDPWQKMDEPFVYYDSVTTLGVLKRCIAVAVVLGVVLAVLSTAVGGLHKISNRYPRAAMAMHAAVLVVVVAFSVQVLVDFEHPFTRFAAMHMLLEAMASPLVVYTPERKQRIALRQEFSTCCRRRRSKQVAVWVYSARLLLCTPVAVLGVCDAAWIAMDAEFDLLIGLAVCVVFMTGVHTVAFVTAVHEVQIPLRINDHAVVHRDTADTVCLRSLPVALHGKGWVTKVWKPTDCRIYAASMLLRGGKASAIVLWDIGSVRYGKVRVEKIVVSKVVYVANGVGDLEKFGEMNTNGVLCRDNDVTAISRVLGFLLWVHPGDDGDPEQNLNMVHNLRAESHRWQKQCCCVKCAAVWWCAVALWICLHAVLLYFVWDRRVWWLIVVETVGVLVTLDFGMVVATRVAPSKMRGGGACPSHHSTVAAVVDHEQWTCDVCKRELKEGERADFCETCDWVRCEVCGV